MAASTGLIHSGAMSECCAPSVSNTNPNSPACARNKPVRRDTPGVAPRARASTVTSSALASTGSRVSNSTSPQRSHTDHQSSFMPMVMKNKPSNTS